MKRKTNNKGFTITELVIVIAVIAILASVLIPTFSNVVKKANESAYSQEANVAMKNYMANMAENGEPVGNGMLFVYDKAGSDTNLGALTIGGKADGRYYYAYINNTLHSVEVVGTLKDVMSGIGDYFQAKATENGPYFDVNDFLVYKVKINNTQWYGVASISGVKGYGSSLDMNADAIRVCTGLAVAAEAAVADNGAGAALVVQSADTKVVAGVMYEKLTPQKDEAGTVIAGSYEMVETPKA